MGIDSSIALGVKPVQIENPMNALAQMMQIKDAQQTSQLNAMKMDEFRQGQERTNRLNTLLGGFKPDTAPDDQVGQLTRGGFLPEARTLAESSAKVAKERRDAEKAQLEGTVQKLALGAQILGGVRDQASYDAARATAQAHGLDVSRMPPEFNPAFVAQKLQEGQTVKEQLEQVWKQKGYDLDVQKVGETQRHNKSTEGLTAQGQQIQVRGQDLTDVRQREFNAAKTEENRLKAEASSTSAKPLPAPALKMQQASLDAINIASNTQADLSAIEKQIASGALKFGLISNLANRGLNVTGLSTEESRNFSSFKSSLETLRNNSLRLNTGVQTDGDAQRAWNELFENINDTGVVKQRLAEIKKLNERAVVQHKLNVDGIRANYGHAPMDTSGYETQGPAVGAGSGATGSWGDTKAPTAPTRIKNAADYASIPSGATYIDPNGQMRKKP